MCKIKGNELTKIIDEELSTKLCAGCDKKDDYLSIWNKNHKPYCPRCLEEIKAVYDKKVEYNA